ncbi:Uncharacterised protein [Starkeya nomas]|uniref:Uncharacterized protein n=1 Tax=Starkeya nomas TaxID=2666134 RepID=A0A5S9NCG2_9HYPH|nr:hypothetical protein [Starkeya nomas]CAA0087028.1 Uncharacterised protein [Starkeya nomas]
MVKTPAERAAALKERQRKAFDDMGRMPASWKIVLARAVVSILEVRETITADDLRSELERLQAERAPLAPEVEFSAEATRIATEIAISRLVEAETKRKQPTGA